MPIKSSSFVVCIVVLLMTIGAAFAGTPDTVSAVSGLTISGTAAVATDTLGYIYIADTGGNRVIMANSSGATTLTIGTGTAGFMPTNGRTGLFTTVADTTIQFNAPAGIATDSKGNVYIADTGNDRIHMIVADAATKLVSTASQIITIAGNGIAGFSGDGAIATGASLKSPTAVAVDSTGIVYIADNGNYRIRKELPTKFTTNTATGLITAYTVGTISTIAGDGTATKLTAYSIALSPAPVGDLYIADAGNNRILKLVAAKGALVSVAGTGTAGFSGDGGIATVAQLDQPSGVATDGKDLYIADTMNDCVRKVSLATGVISTRLGSIAQASAIAAPDSFIRPVSIAVDAVGTVYVEDTGNSAIQQVFASISAITTVSPPGGNYATALNVVLTSSKAAKIYYTIDGATPDNFSLLYTKPLTISTPTTLKFRSIDVAGIFEVTNTAIYSFFSATIPSTTISISATPVNGVYSSTAVLAVSLLPDNPAHTIYYTVDGKAPTNASAIYTVPFIISATTTVKYFAMDAAGNKELVKTQIYTVDKGTAPTTTASLPSGTYASVQSVKLTASDAKATIYFTTDETVPTTASSKYTAPFLISNSTTLQYFAKDLLNNTEPVKIQKYTIITLTSIASPKGGVFNVPQTVVLSSNGEGTTIYYTVDGTDPVTSKKVLTYNNPILLQGSKVTLNFYAKDTKGVIGKVTTEIYTVDSAAPTSVAKCGAAANMITITATDAVDLLPKIMYSTSNSSTFTGAALAYYTTPITFTQNTIVRFFAVDVAGNTELVKTAYCPSFDFTTTPTTSTDPNPALYLETLADGTTTSNSMLYITGNVAPFDTIIAFNGASPDSRDTTDGRFTYLATVADLPVNELITAAGATIDTRNITTGATTTDVTIGKSNGVTGHSVRIPITLKSGYQAAAVRIDIGYDAAKLFNPSAQIAKSAAALDKSIQGNIFSPGIYRVLIMDTRPPAASTTKLTPLPDGDIAYLTFTIPFSSSAGIVPLTIASGSGYSATDLGAADMTVNDGVSGLVNIVTKPGNSIGADPALGTNVDVALKHVMDAYYMLLNPDVSVNPLVPFDPVSNQLAHPIDGAADLNADGVVQIYEFQQVINSLLGIE